MEFAAFVSFALLIVAWVVLPLRGAAVPSATVVVTESLAEPAAA